MKNKILRLMWIAEWMLTHQSRFSPAQPRSTLSKGHQKIDCTNTTFWISPRCAESWQRCIHENFFNRFISGSNIVRSTQETTIFTNGLRQQWRYGIQHTSQLGLQVSGGYINSCRSNTLSYTRRWGSMQTRSTTMTPNLRPPWNRHSTWTRQHKPSSKALLFLRIIA